MKSSKDTIRNKSRHVYFAEYVKKKESKTSEQTKLFNFQVNY